MEEVTTKIYMVRHAESKYVPGVERTRGLTDKGILDSKIVADILQDEIDVVVSSPYQRAIQTVDELANRLNLRLNYMKISESAEWRKKDILIKREEI